MIQNNVLIVDDDKHICELISVILSKEGYHTVTARTGKEALEKLKEGYFDIALVDINMPDISGVQVLHSIKESSRETVVVMITGDASVETAVETLKGGAFDYITKPFEVDYLKETIKKAIESPGLNTCPHITYVTDTNLRLEVSIRKLLNPRDITQSKRDKEDFRKLHQEIVEANLKLQQTMKLLRVSESKWRSMVENAPDIIMTVDCDGTILFINRTVPGFTPEQTIGTSVYDYIPPEHHDRKTKSSVNEVNTIRESLGRVFQTGEADRKPKASVSEANRYEIAGVGPHGSRIGRSLALPSWYESRVGAIKSNGQVESAVIITTDITERKQAEKKLEQYKLMVEAAHDAIFFKDLESRYMVANRKTLESFGLSRDEVIGKNDYELMPNREEAKKNVDDDQIVFNTGKPTEITKHMTGSDGKEYWFQAIKVPQFDDEGNIAGLVGIARDITERKQLEDALRKSEEKYRLIFENAKEGISIYEEFPDGSRKLVECNPQYTEMSGYSREELIQIGDTLKIQVGHSTPQQEAVNMEKLLAGQPYSGAFSWIRPDGKENYIEYTAASFNMEGRRFTVGIDHDVTERKRMEEALRESEHEKALILSSLSELVSYQDNELRIIWANRAAGELAGLSADELVGRHCYEIWQQRSEPCIGCPVLEAFETGEPQEAEMTTPNGRVWFIRSYPVRGRNGDIVGVVEIVLEITERKRAEEQIKASLKEKEILLKEVHHRVKNNMQIISSLLDLQADSVEDEQTLEIFNESKNRIRTMALVHEYLYQSKDLARIDFAEYIQNLANNVFQSYENSNAIQLRINVEDDISLSIDEANPCGLILNELVSNSLKHAFPEGREGEIRIDFRSEEDKYTLIVSSNGVDFPENVDFRNTETLGLQLVVDLTEQLGGTIELDRSSGTTFKITFPQAK